MSMDLSKLPDMEDLARQMEDALAEAQGAMEGLPTEMGQMEGALGALSALMQGMPAQMAELSSAMAGLGEAQAASAEALAGEPDWGFYADIRIGNMLHLGVEAEFDLVQAVQTFESTQGPGLESLVAGLVQDVAGDDFEPGLTEQVLGQVQKGRGMALVRNIDVIKCQIPGAPGDAASTLQLSPEANIPLVVDEGSLGFEFAPMLTIRNQWERADIPVFAPMGEEVLISLSRFEDGESFSMQFSPVSQEYKVSIELRCSPL